MKWLEKLFVREPDMANEYKAFMLEYLELGQMEKIPDDKVTDYIGFIILLYIIFLHSTSSCI